jgi:hypothetical protein
MVVPRLLHLWVMLARERAAKELVCRWPSENIAGGKSPVGEDQG